MHRIIIFMILQYYYGLGSDFFLSDWSGLRSSNRSNSRHRIDVISSNSALLHSMLQPRTRTLYPYIINVDCCVVSMHHIPRNLPRAARIVLSLWSPPSARHPSRRQYYHSQICTQPRSPPPILHIYISLLERWRE